MVVIVGTPLIGEEGSANLCEVCVCMLSIAPRSDLLYPVFVCRLDSLIVCCIARSLSVVRCAFHVELPTRCYLIREPVWGEPSILERNALFSTRIDAVSFLCLSSSRHAAGSVVAFAVAHLTGHLWWYQLPVTPLRYLSTSRYCCLLLSSLRIAICYTYHRLHRRRRWEAPSIEFLVPSAHHIG